MVDKKNSVASQSNIQKNENSSMQITARLPDFD